MRVKNGNIPNNRNQSGLGQLIPGTYFKPPQARPNIDEQIYGRGMTVYTTFRKPVKRFKPKTLPRFNSKVSLRKWGKELIFDRLNIIPEYGLPQEKERNSMFKKLMNTRGVLRNFVSYNGGEMIDFEDAKEASFLSLFKDKVFNINRVNGFLRSRLVKHT